MPDFPEHTTRSGERIPLLPSAPQPEQSPDPDFVLHLRPLRSNVPTDQRLKQLLKVALRRFQFRLVRMTEVQTEGKAK